MMAIWIRLKIVLHVQDRRHSALQEETVEVDKSFIEMMEEVWWNNKEETVEVDKNLIELIAEVWLSNQEKAAEVEWINQEEAAEVEWINQEEAAEVEWINQEEAVELIWQWNLIEEIVELDRNNIKHQTNLEETAEVEWKKSQDPSTFQIHMDKKKMSVKNSRYILIKKSTMRQTNTLTNSDREVRAQGEETEMMIGRWMKEIEARKINLILMTTNAIDVDLTVVKEVILWIDNIEVMHKMKDIDKRNSDLSEVIDVTIRG